MTQELTRLTILKEISVTSQPLILVLLPDSKQLEQLPLILTAISGATVTLAGTGYSTAPSVTITGGGGIGGIVESTIEDGGVVSLSVVDPGTGYSAANPPVLILAPPEAVQFIKDEHVVIGGMVHRVVVEHGHHLIVSLSNCTWWI